MKNKKNYKVGILSLGCPRNLVDSEFILGRLNYKGYSIVENILDADIAIINTCAFIEEAKKESIDAILDLISLKKEGKIKKIIVYGCLPQRYKYTLKRELPEIDAFIGRVSLNHHLERFSLTPKHYAYLKICEGCLNKCSFCVIPKIKGKFSSLSIESILEIVEKFNQEELKELNIIGQDITGYGIDLYKKPKLNEVLKKIIKRIDKIKWLRLLYLYPDKRRLNSDLLYLIKDEPKLCKYIDLPIQHINDRILKLMRRNTTKKEIIELIHKIRKIIPQVGIRSSLIVGFPSETDKEFKELLEFVKEIKFERLGVFMYSREETSPAYNFQPQIPKQVKIKRFNEIMSIQQEVSIEINKRFLGKTIDVLIDEKDKDIYLGRTQYDAPEVDGLVYVKSKKLLNPGDFVKAKIVDTLEYDLVAEGI